MRNAILWNDLNFIACVSTLLLCYFQKSWDIALGPFKQIPMNLFIMYMAGNSISIFPIMMVGMMFLRPVKALLAVKSSKSVLLLSLLVSLSLSLSSEYLS